MDRQIKNCPKCGGILPASAEACPACAIRQAESDDTRISTFADSGSTVLPLNLLANAGVPGEIGQYQIIRKLGEGGMGAVYEALQPTLDRRVALKVMSTRFSTDSSFQQRFEREAKAAASVTHPNLVHVYDFGESNGLRFIAMELIEGGSVGHRLRDSGRMNPLEAIDTVTAAARALQAAKEGGVIHRDIKPDNLLIDKKGNIRVADLGLARQLDADSNVTNIGTMLGSPYYMAPEQAQDASSADHRADIYSLGITLFSLLTGKKPFAGSSVREIINAHAYDEIPKLEESGLTLPALVDSTIAKMTAKQPDERYPDYPSLLADLLKCRAHLDPRTAAARSTSSKNNDLIITSVACAILLAVTYFGLQQAKRNRAPARQTIPPVRSVAMPPVPEATKPAEAKAASGLEALPRDNQSIFEKYQAINFNGQWLPFNPGRPPRRPTMDGTFEENLKLADDFAAANPESYGKVVAHYLAALRAEPIASNREIIEAKLNIWVEKETAAFEALFIKHEARMLEFAKAGKYRAAYESWADFPSDYPFPRFMGLIWAAISKHIPEEELRKILDENDFLKLIQSEDQRQ